ncbi:protein-disulfide reductase DsbD domain-containing protein, partial [Rhodovulum imhoffii]
MPRQFTLPVLAMCIAVAMAGILGGGRALAASSAPAASDMVSARLLTAENGVAPGASTVSAALEISLTQGWKTYWRTPGEVGLPPRIEWSGSRNVAGAEILWPAPDRFTAFGIENFGYSGETVLPLRVNLENPGEPVALRAQVSLLICAEICVPQDFDLALDLPAGTGIDPEAAASIARHVARVPLSTEEAGLSLERAHLDDEALTLALRAQAAFTAPDIFPELGEGAALGAPDIRLGEDGRFLWARLPVLAPVTPGAASITVTDGARAVTLDLPLSETPPAPPFDVQERHAGAGELVAVALVALLGGLILNVMPCVLPVLSIKLSSALTAQGQSPVRVRGGFLMAALGVMLFMWGLAAATLAARAFGLSVGWGLQFQNPVFLAAMFMILVVFAANLLGLYEINLPASWQTRLARADGAPGYGGDLATGAFAAVLATPCSAPFLGTALAFALSGRVVDVLVIFTALGLGLALPYLLVAAVPGAMLRLPRPGRWMLWVKLGLGVLLAVTAGWLIWV